MSLFLHIPGHVFLNLRCCLQWNVTLNSLNAFPAHTLLPTWRWYESKFLAFWCGADCKWHAVLILTRQSPLSLACHSSLGKWMDAIKHSVATHSVSTITKSPSTFVWVGRWWDAAVWARRWNTTAECSGRSNNPQPATSQYLTLRPVGHAMLVLPIWHFHVHFRRGSCFVCSSFSSSWTNSLISKPLKWFPALNQTRKQTIGRAWQISLVISVSSKTIALW